MTHTYIYPRPALTVDIVCLYGNSVLLIRRKNPPYQNCWALPGGFVDMEEEVETSAARELKEETGISITSLSLVDVFSRVDRDPRERVISIAYVTELDTYPEVKAGDDAVEVGWFDRLPDDLAFDHREIIERAIS